MPRPLTKPLLLSTALVWACVGENPSWDPPSVDEGADTLTETGAGTETDTSPGTTETGSGESTDTGVAGTWGTDTGGFSTTDTGGSGGPVCGQGDPAIGACPPSCDECVNGVCWRYCTADLCEDASIVCPPSWPCHIVCFDKDGCKDAAIACGGGGSCEVDCAGERACEHTVVVCSDGPCEVRCEAGFNEPCRETAVACGSKDTQLSCAEPFAGNGPTLEGVAGEGCVCESDCVPA